jgi:hypothetical protein
MAGKQMILVCGGGNGAGTKDEMSITKQLANMPESILSAQQAVADIGFEQTLGWLNVHEGTQVHKRIIKGYMMQQQQQQQHQQRGGNNNNIWKEALQHALQQQLPKQQQSKNPPLMMDFFPLIRRVMLQATIDVMIGTFFLDGWDYDFLHSFMTHWKMLLPNRSFYPNH